MKAWGTDKFSRARQDRWVLGALIVILIAVILYITISSNLVFVVANLAPVVAGFGVTIAAATFALGQLFARHQSRKQHTIKILFDSRLSAEFRKILDLRRAIWREGEMIDAGQFFADLALNRADIGQDADKQARQNAAEAVRDVLNYYEFISLGILLRDLDEELLRETLRSIMCNFVRDCRAIIIDAQTRNSKTYENLVVIYDRWRDDRHPEIPKPKPQKPAP